MRAEPWFYVGEHDVFPETFIDFVGFDPTQRAALLRTHGQKSPRTMRTVPSTTSEDGKFTAFLGDARNPHAMGVIGQNLEHLTLR